MVSKPSEFTPLVWRMAVDGWKQIGAPDVLDAVFGFGDTGAALVGLLDYVMFTGSVNTGRRIAVAAAQGNNSPLWRVTSTTPSARAANDSQLGVVRQRVDTRQEQGDGIGAQGEHRNGEHQQRHHQRPAVPGTDGRLERIRGRLPLGWGRRDPQILPHQKHCRRPGYDEGAALVSLQPQEGPAPCGHGPDHVGQRLAATTRTVTPGYNHHDAAASK